MSTARGKNNGGSTVEDPTPALGKTIQRLRKAYNMSLGELSEQSGVAKSIISQIERNETNPTIATVYRLSKALEFKPRGGAEGGRCFPLSAASGAGPQSPCWKARMASAASPSPGR